MSSSAAEKDCSVKEGAPGAQTPGRGYELRRAFPDTIPVMMGYLFAGMAFGVLLRSKGYSFVWAGLMSLLVYAGSLQFIAVNFFAPGVRLLSVAFLTLLVNIRHVFYGLSMLEKFKGMGWRKLYLIFSLTDETYSLLCGVKVPEGVRPARFYFWIALLHQIYWVSGSVLGGLAGAFLPFDSTGIDFTLTALFTVIFVEQWLNTKDHLPALLGLGAAAVCLLVFGPDGFLLPALLAAVCCLLIFRGPSRKGEKA